MAAKVVARLLGWMARLDCVFGCHAYGYSPMHDAVLCFACGRRAPLSEWREHDAMRRRLDA